MSALEKTNHASLSAREQVEALSDMLAPGASAAELQMIAATAERLGLDLLGRQVYAVKRYNAQVGREAWTVQVSIDGFRLIAERSGRYVGQLGPFWCGADGEWRDVWLESKPPRAARVGVLRRDFVEPCWAVALYDEYVQKKRDGVVTKMWSERPALMLAKCAESLALRKAFPQELSGVYTADEMPEVEATAVERPALTPARVPEQPAEPSPGGRTPHEIVSEGLAALTSDERKRLKAHLERMRIAPEDKRVKQGWLDAIVDNFSGDYEDAPLYEQLPALLAALDEQHALANQKREPDATPLERRDALDERSDAEAEGLFGDRGSGVQHIPMYGEGAPS